MRIRRTIRPASTRTSARRAGAITHTPRPHAAAIGGERVLGTTGPERFGDAGQLAHGPPRAGVDEGEAAIAAERPHRAAGRSNRHAHRADAPRRDRAGGPRVDALDLQLRLLVRQHPERAIAGGQRHPRQDAPIARVDPEQAATAARHAGVVEPWFRPRGSVATHTPVASTAIFECEVSPASVVGAASPVATDRFPIAPVSWS